ncbi:oligosaccharide flippase family protein [Luteimonas sp. 8-5]|uniref:oligosaccharide flippase family protein n=1 Tax=Luteimonas sp. 8-5 TaxID=3039387 RepID=UPI0024364A3D|nr:oligosaccharide flippase family protein [Luteimonas sp. 8-5]MDG6348290.1 oligosaccharide flippase family protein [Luteimonas sp. 8-5]
MKLARFLNGGEFSRNVLRLMAGTTIAQAIPIGISPILTRIYTPQDFGVLALFVSITSVFASVASARYEQAIVLPDSDEDALTIAALGLTIVVSISTLLLVCVAAFGDEIAVLLKNEAIGGWLYFIPLTVLSMGIFNILVYTNSRRKQFGEIATANIAKSIAMATVQLLVGIFKSGPAGLVLGHVASSLVSNARLFRRSLSIPDLFRAFQLSALRRNAVRYRDFPLYSMPGIFANTLSLNVASVLISGFFGVATLGQYALVQRVMTAPATLMGTAIGQVFYQRAAEQMRHQRSANAAFLSAISRLAVLSTVIFGALYFVVDDLFVFIFGANWAAAGKMAKIMSPLFAIRFVASPLSMMNQVYGRNHVGLIINLTLLLATVGIIWGGSRFLSGFDAVLQCLTVVLSAIYLAMLLVIHRYARDVK